MKQELAAVALVVRDYDEAIAFYTKKLLFELQEDVDLGSGKRWVRVTPPGVHTCANRPTLASAGPGAVLIRAMMASILASATAKPSRTWARSRALRSS